MEIRKANISDLDALSVLFNDYRVFYNKTADLPAARSFLHDRISNRDAEIFVAESNEDGLFGFVQLYPIFSSTRMKRLWLLNDLFINHEYRGQGHSLRLIEACKKLCYQTDSCGMILETAKDNTIGNRLYNKAGFVADNNHNYYEWEIQSDPKKS